MLIFKLLGSGALLLCGILYPRMCQRDRHRALRQADALLALVRFMREQIEYYRMPLDEILVRCERDVLCYFGEGSSLLQMFENTVFYDSDVRAIAMELAFDIGRGYCAEQRLICQRAIDSLVCLAQKRTEASEKKKKTESVLGFGAAALVVILFI